MERTAPRRLLLPLVAALALSAPVASGAASLVARNAGVSLYFSGGGGAKSALLAAIDAARQSIRVHSFFLSDREIASALIRAHTRGVDVEALLCRRGQTEAIDPQGGRLARAGIPVFLNGRFRALHNKVMIFDRKTVQTGSYNYRFDADCLDAENVIFISSPAVADLYLEDYARRRAEAVPYDLKGPFKKLTARSGKSACGKSRGLHASFPALPVEVYFAPDGGAKESVLSHIRRARRSITVHSYYLSDPEIAAALIAAHESGIRVATLFSAKAGEKDKAPFLGSMLEAAGIPVRLDPLHRNAHNKVIIYDDEIVQTGSYNLKMHVNDINAENVIYLHAPQLAAAYRDNYLRHLAHSGSAP